MTQTIPIRVTALTYAVLTTLAKAQGLAPEEVAEQMVMRDAAQATGWPGQLGQELRNTVSAYLRPAEGALEEIPF